MGSLIAAEFKKLLTTRSTYLLAAAVAVAGVVTVFDPGHDASTFAKPFHEQAFVLFTALITRIFILVLGIRAVTDEFRHGTIVPSFLVTPRRAHVIVAKGVAVAVFGAILGLVAWGAITIAASALAVSDGTTLTVGEDALRSMAGMVAGGAMWAVIGLGLGAILRSQLVATVGGLVWLMGIEDAVKGWFGDLAGYLPGQAGLALATAPDERAALTGVVTLLAYALVIGLGALFAIRRDVG
jgi:ABC-2 type transport system permease protein